MTRPLRVNSENGWYHVYARGVNRMTIFRDDRDREHLLELLEGVVDRYRVLLHAYVLMQNHFHLVLQTPDANLSKAMHWLNLSWAAWFNARHGRTGPVFQRPFGSKPVEDSSWAYQLSTYVHLNPLRIRAFSLNHRARAAARVGIGRKPTKEEVEERLKKLRSWKWSSYRFYAGYNKAPDWLYMEELLGRASRVEKDQKKEYRRHLQDILKQGGDTTVRERVVDAVAIGSAEFVRRIKEFGISGAMSRETSQKRSIRRRVGMDDVIRAVEETRGESWEEFANRHGDPGKALVMWLARKYTGLTLREIGQALGGRDYAAVSVMLKRFEQQLEDNKGLAKQKNEAADMINC